MAATKRGRRCDHRVGNVSLRRRMRSFSLRAMSFLRCLFLLLCLAFAGCRLGSQGAIDEQKEPYFLAAKKRIQEHDPQGAIEYFEKALDVNPRSATAHGELGMLYEKQEPPDFAAALYHYKRALDIRPDLASGDLFRMRMEDCKRELAKSVVLLPTMEQMQRKLDALTTENQQLKIQLQAAMRGLPYANPLPTNAPSNPPPPAYAGNQQANPAPNTARKEAIPNVRPNPLLPNPQPVVPRTHTVSPGETLASIAKRYNVRITTLQNANPSVDARRLRPGQTLAIPSSQ